MASSQDTLDASPAAAARPAIPRVAEAGRAVGVREPITVEQAREVLAAAGSPAADPDTYAALRGDTGWVFHPGPGAPPLEAFAWVVSDRGRPRGVPSGTTAEDMLAHISKQPAAG